MTVVRRPTFGPRLRVRQSKLILAGAKSTTLRATRPICEPDYSLGAIGSSMEVRHATRDVRISRRVHLERRLPKWLVEARRRLRSADLESNATRVLVKKCATTCCR
jgi:hypothetical protein